MSAADEVTERQPLRWHTTMICATQGTSGYMYM